MRALAIRRLILLLAAVLFSLFVTSSPSWATPHSCGDVWCNGNDSSTRYNTNGNEPQFYGGEIGTYLNDFGGPSSPCPSGLGNMCFLKGAADAAKTKYQNDTGIGVQAYYFMGGPASSRKPSGVSNYCWGWKQADKGFSHLGNEYSDYASWILVIFGDIEQGATYGWGSNATANRSVLSGFRDHIGDLASAEPSGCNDTHTAYQLGIYSTPGDWTAEFSGTGSLNNFMEWTPVHCCVSTNFPGGFSSPSASADWFGSPGAQLAWQYYLDPDYDVAKSGLTMPVLGYALGD